VTSGTDLLNIIKHSSGVTTKGRDRSSLPRQKEEAPTMPAEHLTKRPSRRWVVVLTIGLAVAVALSMAFASDADAKKKNSNRTSTERTNVFCDENSFNRCTSTIDPNTPGALRFVGSGVPKTNDVTFRRVEDNKRFRKCVFEGRVNESGHNADKYSCKADSKKKNKNKKNNNNNNGGSRRG
jgi:hypothetical protein